MYRRDNMTNIHVAICDDDSTFLELIKSKINQFYLSKNVMSTITEFTNGGALVKACKEIKFDLILKCAHDWNGSDYKTKRFL